MKKKTKSIYKRKNKKNTRKQKLHFKKGGTESECNNLLNIVKKINDEIDNDEIDNDEIDNDEIDNNLFDNIVINSFDNNKINNNSNRMIQIFIFNVLKALIFINKTEKTLLQLDTITEEEEKAIKNKEVYDNYAYAKIYTNKILSAAYPKNEFNIHKNGNYKDDIHTILQNDIEAERKERIQKKVTTANKKAVEEQNDIIKKYFSNTLKNETTGGRLRLIEKFINLLKSKNTKNICFTINNVNILNNTITMKVFEIIDCVVNKIENIKILLEPNDKKHIIKPSRQNVYLV